MQERRLEVNADAPTLGDRARDVLAAIDTGATRDEIRDTAEATLGDLVAVGVADHRVERGDLVMSLDPS